MRAHHDRGETPSRADSARPAPPISSTHLFAAAAVLTALNIAGAFAPHAEATWAVAYPKAIPAGARALIALAGPLLALAIAARMPRAGAHARAARIAGTPWPWMALLLAIHVALPNTHPYGDAVRFYRFIPGATGPEANAPLSFEVHRAVARAFPGDLVFGFSSLAAIGGLIAVAGIFRLARSLFPADDDASRRTLFLAGMAASGAWQIFAGYVEHYHVQLALILWGLAFLFAETRSVTSPPSDGASAAPRSRAAAGALVLGLAAAWNLSAGWLLPLPALLAYRRGGGAARAAAWTILPVAATLALLVATYGPERVAASYTGGFHPLATPFAGFLPPAQWFSRAHLLFLLNETLLVAPIALTLGFAVRPERPGRRALLLLAGLFAFAWNPRLGWAKDWDLFIWALVAIQVVVLEAALRREPSPARRTPWAALIGSGAALTLIYLVCNSAFGRPR